MSISTYTHLIMSQIFFVNEQNKECASVCEYSYMDSICFE